MKKCITPDQEKKVIQLYKSEKYTIKQIRQMTDVLSEQTIYRILNEHHIPKRRLRVVTKKISISLDEETENIIKLINPKNVSVFVCDAIKKTINTNLDI